MRTNRTQLFQQPGIVAGCAALALAIGACGGGGGASKKSNGTPGKVEDKPGGGFYIVDANQAGNAQEPRLVRQAFGRLVEVFGFDSVGLRVPMASKFVVDESILGDGQNYALETNSVTAQQNLLILRDVTDVTQGGGRDQFFALLLKAEANLGPIQSAASGGSGIYSMVPRNSVVMVQFDDLVDEATLDKTTFRTLVGNPPVVPFEGRAFVDPNHGDLADFDGKDGLEFYSTRIIFDPTITEIESFENDPPLPINGVGLPASSETELANFEFRIPTKINAAYGQTKLLTNPSGHPVTSKSNGPVDFGSPTIDVVRAARSGGPTQVTQDPFNGFLRDLDSPQLVGSNQVFVAAAPVSANGYDEFILPSTVFASAFCSQTPEPGDILRQPGLFAEVLVEPDPVQNGEVTDLLVRLLLWPSAWDESGLEGPLEWIKTAVGDGDFLAPYDPTEDAAQSVCFVRVLPTPNGFPDDPASGLFTASTISFRFSEPMDPSSVTAFDSMTVTRKDVPESTSDYVVGTMIQSLDLQDFTFVPDLPFAHEQGQEESYFVTILSGQLGPSDLAGNELSNNLPKIEMSIDANEATQANGGRVSRFTSTDEDPPFGDSGFGSIPEWSGQHLYDLAREVIRPRPAVHYNSVCDRSRPVVLLMTPFTQGVQTPLSGLGSKLHHLWRYIDFGMALTDVSSHNIDVEGLYWAPVGGSIQSETFSELEIALAHSKAAPDEILDPGTLFPQWFASGLDKKFVSNLLDKAEDPLKVVHPRSKGYALNPGEVIVAPGSGTKLMPWPVNRDTPPEEWETYTWRDTSLRKRAGNNNGGVDPGSLFAALGILPTCNPYYPTKQVRTIGLALLVQVSCYPDDGATGVNAFDISLAVNSSSRPYFRAYSTGGINQSGNRELVDPDTETDANGGYNPLSNPPGATTWWGDCSFYIGAADFVTRVSRSHSLFFAATNPLTGDLFSAPSYVDPVMEPTPEVQPAGTSVTLSFRGITGYVEKESSCQDGTIFYGMFEDASWIDTYGDVYDDKCLPPAPPQGGCTPGPLHNLQNENAGMQWLVQADDTWKPTIEEINTAPYYQVRITFEANIFTGLTPELSALAVSWYQ